MTIPAPLGALLTFGPPVALAWVFAVEFKRRTVRRSRERYWAATVERALRYPCLAHMVAAVTLATIAHDWVYMAIDALALGIWVLVYVRAVRGGDDDDDDDDWFSDVGQRLRRLAGRPVAAGSAA